MHIYRFMHEKIRKLWENGWKKEKIHTHNNNKRYGNDRNEKNTTYTQHFALNVSSLSLLMVGYIIGVCLPYTKHIHAHTFTMFSVFCFSVCVLVAAMFILPVYVFVYTSTTQCQNTAAFLHASNVWRGITSTYFHCTQTICYSSNKFLLWLIEI